MTAGNCKSGMIKAPTLPSSAAGSLGLCFDFDGGSGLEVNGEVILKDGDPCDQALDQRLVKLRDGSGLLPDKVLQVSYQPHLLVPDYAVDFRLLSHVPESENLVCDGVIIVLLIGFLQKLLLQLPEAFVDTVVFPLTVIALAIAVMIGDGCCAFVSLNLGRKQPDIARKSVGNSISMVIVSSLVLSAVYLAFSNQIIAMFGGTVNAETFRHSKEYFFYITLGIPFYMFGQALNPIIRADGSPKFAMASTLAGAIINIILDPIFIFVFKWGMMGAAVATVIGQVVTAAFAVWYIVHMKLVRPSKSDFRMNGGVCRKSLVLGITSFLSQISLVAAMAAINNMIRK